MVEESAVVAAAMDQHGHGADIRYAYMLMPTVDGSDEANFPRIDVWLGREPLPHECGCCTSARIRSDDSLSPELTESLSGLNCPSTVVSLGRISSSLLKDGSSQPSCFANTDTMTCEPLPISLANLSSHLPCREIPNVVPLRSEML